MRVGGPLWPPSLPYRREQPLSIRVHTRARRYVAYTFDVAQDVAELLLFPLITDVT